MTCVRYNSSQFRLLKFGCNFIHFSTSCGTAAEIKCFGPVLLATWDNFMNSNLALHRQIRLMLKLNVHMENILSDYAHEIALPAGPAESFKRAAFQMGQVYSMVA